MISLSEMIRVLGEEMGVEPRVVRSTMQPGDVERTYADIDKAARLLGYRPDTPFREGIRAVVRWLEQRPVVDGLEHAATDPTGASGP